MRFSDRVEASTRACDRATFLSHDMHGHSGWILPRVDAAETFAKNHEKTRRFADFSGEI